MAGTTGAGEVVRRSHAADYGLILLTFVLVAIGLIVMYSISPIQSQKLVGSASRNFYFYNHLVNVGIGLVCWIVASQIRYTTWRKWAPRIMLVAIFALLVIMVPGLSFAKNGATRWLKLGPVSFQPAELMKLALVLYLANWFEKKGKDISSLSEAIIPFGVMMALISLVIVVFQRDMGTMLVLAGLALGMLWVAGVRPRHFLGMIGSGLAAGWLAIILFPHRMERLLTFLDPSRDSSDTGYHIQQALIAVGSGGLFGVGLGRSVQVYGYLPEAPNDSIFAIIAEEFGMIGSVMLIILFGLLVWRAFRIARKAPDTFGRLVATGIGIWLMFQAIINIGAMLSLIPLTGIPLPYISYGGSSLVMSMFAIGILVNISKYTTYEAKDANSRLRRGDSGSYLADPRYSRTVKAAR